MLQAEDPEQCAAPGFSSGTAGSTSFSQGEDDGVGDDFFFGFGGQGGDVEDDFDGCFRVEVDGDGGIGDGGEGDDNLSISVDQLLAFLDEPNDAPLEFEGGEAEAEAEAQAMQEMMAADDDYAAAGEQAQEQPCSSSPPSTSLMEYLPSCSSTSNDINATPSHRVSYSADPVYMKAALHNQRPGLEGFLGAHEADIRLTEGPHIDINNYDTRNILSSNMSNDDTHGLSPDCLRFSCPEYVSQCATGGSSIPSLSAPVSPPFSEIMSNSTVQHETIDGMNNFRGYRDQDGTDIGTTCMPWSNPSSQRISYETDEDTKSSMNIVGVRKNGIRGHCMMPEEHGSAFSIHSNFANNGYQCSVGGTSHDLPHTNLDLTLSNMSSGKLYNRNGDVKLENNSCSVGKYVNGISSTVPLQGVSLHSSEYFYQGVERASQSCESASFFVKNEQTQNVKREFNKALYSEVPLIDLDDPSDPHYKQGITYAASAESSPNHIPEDEYYGIKHEFQSLPRMDFVPLKNNAFSECYNKHYISEFHMTALQKNTCVDVNAEVQILDDLNGPCSRYIAAPIKSLNKSISGVPGYDHAEDFSLGSKACDEKLTYQIALQDLTQPLSESSPPDGVLAVPLLRHQRIALSWMVQKETSNQNCSGGILADDQGLGKTVSTIALILSERSPSFQSCEQAGKQVEVETLSSDDEDPQINDRNQPGNFECKKGKQSVVDNGSTLPLKGRPAAGTLVVCPTSVLRQWADEIQNKVTNKGKLSLLLYHGPNRTKDPSELAKYDVVLTTYSIVSMEVPKQVVDDKDDEDKAKQIPHVPMGSSSSKKRKQNPSKVKTTADGKPVEVIARPLAKVAWFRVILDEAQTIKNHRTLVAKACCGLRAKRRWCLSGTPIQNSIDDLYSYFRFLRYDPYAIYSSFCSSLKLPINRNPAIGYRKLQAVLKTILLRRTKGTFLEGEPIIKLPPKSVELKRLDFSIDERKFYDNLEAESRAQFKAYADAGTVKENYVNILLMLLRLRQACDHPVLAHGSDSSVLPGETVKQLSRGKCLDLLNCLEASQAICRICSDPPEDAVVSICGHVFCNQCVSEHLTGDIKHCPTARCKVKLNATSVFTKASLKNSIDDLPRDDISTGSCVTQEISEQKTDVFSSASSKIKTAMEILLSLPILEQSSKHVATFKTSDFSSIKHETADIIQVNDTHETILTKGEAGCLYEPQGLSSKRKEKALVFSQWTRMLDLLETQLKSSCIQYRRLDGTMSIADRDKAVKEFNTLPEVTVMIMSLKAASLGLNLVSACHVLLLDLWWNPTTEDQAVDRAHRIGQTRPVTVMRLTVKDTVEDRILALQDKKREMVASAFGEDEKGSRQSRLTVDDLKYLFMM